MVQIFHQAYIPRRLEEVDDYEADFERLTAAGGSGGGRATEGIYYQTIAGMRPDMSGAAAAPAVVEAAARLPASGSESGASDAEGFDLQARLPGAAGRGASVSAGEHFTEEQRTLRAGSAAARDSPAEVDAHAKPAALKEHGSESDTDSSSSSSEDESDSNEEEDGAQVRQDRPVKDAEKEKEDRKAHKKAVKEANREKRKKKLKKHVKKRAINKHKHK